LHTVSTCSDDGGEDGVSDDSDGDHEGTGGLFNASIENVRQMCQRLKIKVRANTTRGLDYEHMIKARAHKGGVRIGKTPKKLASIWCP
jgi:hypothetical protein